MQNDRLYQLKDLIMVRPGISLDDLCAVLEVSRATIKRDIAALRDRFDTPIVYSHFDGGYRIEQVEQSNSRRAVKKAELPGLWFSADEASALLTAQQLLSTIEPGMLGNKLKPLMEKINRLISRNGNSVDDVQNRIRVLPSGKRKLGLESFQLVAGATLMRKRLNIQHFHRERGEVTQREVSLQRLVHYRDNWYLDAWCHLRQQMRSFSVDALRDCDMLEIDAMPVALDELDDHFNAGYGIFAGADVTWAVLKFSPSRSRWVSTEVWHPQQQSQTLADGSFVLKVPYADDRELMGDVLRYGADVEVLEPPALRSAVQRHLLLALGKYVGK